MPHYPVSVTHLQGKLIGIRVGRTVSVMEARVTSLHVEVRRHVRRIIDCRLLLLLMGTTGEIDVGIHRLPQTWGESARM